MPGKVRAKRSALIVLAMALGMAIGAPAALASTAAPTKAGPLGDNGPATAATLRQPDGVAVDSGGNIYIADTADNRIREVSPNGTITTVAGTGTAGYSGDHGPARAAELWNPEAVAVDAKGDIFIADTFNNRVREINPHGFIATVAGTGAAGYTGDGGPADRATLSRPTGVALDPSGNLFILDSGNNRVREVTPSGEILTWASSASPYEFGSLAGLAVDRFGEVYVTDPQRGLVFKGLAGDGWTPVLGEGQASADGAPSLSGATEAWPWGIALNRRGDIFVAENRANYVQKFSFQNGVQRTTRLGTASNFVGNGSTGLAKDGAPAAGSPISQPTGLGTDQAGNLYVCAGNDVFKVTAAGVITRVAGGA